MRRTHVILRCEEERAGPTDFPVRPITRSDKNKPVTSSPAVARAWLDVEALEDGEVAEIRQEPNVRDTAPAMPLKLIQPHDVEVAPPLHDNGIAWGVRAVSADASPFTGAGITVAVLDTGIDASHHAFRDVELIQRDFVGEGNGDADGHGTHCAATVFGQDVNGLRIGVARGISRGLIGKVLSKELGGSTQTLLRAIEWAAGEGAEIISVSLGMDFPGYTAELMKQGMPPEPATSLALEAYRDNIRLFEALSGMLRASALLFGSAPLLVAAAGNESRRGQAPDYVIAASPPAAAEGVLSVGALRNISTDPPRFDVASFSNTRPSVSAPGFEIVSARAGGGLIQMNGTSMAAPHVAGVMALWAEKLSAAKGYDNSAVAANIIAQADRSQIVSTCTDGDVGAGLVQAPLK